ncbi:MAG: hypothetical protein NC215_11365, partial [Ruminococcus sp.]|nr:hypothetical protein [Ruminococcus sp.]
MKMKKVLSLVLSLIMILSVMQASFVAFAADSEKIAAVEEAINSFDSSLNTANPDSSVLEGYDKIVSMFKALSANEKEALNVRAFDKLYHKVIDRERQVALAAGTKGTAAYVAAGKSASEVLGGLPAYLDEAMTVNAVFADKKATAQAKLDAFASASINARIYADLYYASYGCFYYAVESYPSRSFATLVAAVTKEAVAADPFNGGTQPKKLSKPNAKNYAEGEADPQYIADYAAYWDSCRAYQEWDAAKKNHEASKNIEAMLKIAAVAPEYKNIVDAALLANDAKRAYDADSANKAQAAKAVEAYEALSDFEKFQFDKLSTYLYYIATAGSSYWSTTSYAAAKLYSACVDIGNAQYVEAFIDVINSIEEPYTRNDIDKAKAAYALVPSSLAGTLDSEITAKYKAILASIGPDEQNTDKPSTDSYITTAVKYPSGYSKKQVSKAIDNLYDVVLSVMKTDEAGVKKTLEQTVFSSAFIGTIVKLIYPALGNLNSLVAYGPNDLANKLTEEKYQLAVQKLRAAATVDENGKVVKDMADWDKVSFENGDFGFEDGDKEAFLDAASATFRTLSLITMIISLENKISTTQGTYTYGAYEDLIPVLEALDLNGVLSSDEYTKRVQAVSSATQMDARVRPILAPIADLIERVANDPVNTVLDVLPKLAYALKNDIVTTQINKVL